MKKPLLSGFFLQNHKILSMHLSLQMHDLDFVPMLT